MVYRVDDLRVDDLCVGSVIGIDRSCGIRTYRSEYRKLRKLGFSLQCSTVKRKGRVSFYSIRIIG